MLYSYYYSRWSGKAVQCGVPVSVAFEPTTSCNLRCPECPSGLRSFTRPTGMADINFFKKVVDELHCDLMYLIFYFQGEPFLHPHFLEMVRYAQQKNIYTATSTNAHFLDDVNARKTVESGLDRLIISVDGTTQEVYRQYRVGGELEKVMEGTKNVIKWKKLLKSKTPYIIFQFLVVKPNEHQTEDIKKAAEKLGVNEVKFKTAQIHNYKNGHTLIPDNNNFSRYKKKNDGSYILKNKLLNHCWKLWHSCVITWDGMVVPCCFDKDARHRMGNLQHEPFKKIWQNKTYRGFRYTVLKSRKETDICKNCTEGTKIWA